MAEYILETKGLGISFGGLKAAQDVNVRIKKNQIYGLIGPNGAGKTTIFNLLTGVYKPTTGTFYLDGEELKGLSQDKINHKGIARTFQNIRLFNNMTVVRNVMVGLHNQPEYTLRQPLPPNPQTYTYQRTKPHRFLSSRQQRALFRDRHSCR